MRPVSILSGILLLFMATNPVLSTILPNETQQTEFIVSVADQCTISVPDQVVFDVTDVTQNVTASGLTVSATNLVLAQGSVLRIELKADAEDFNAPEMGAATWSASDVSWAAGTWTGGTGSSGTLEFGVYHMVAESVGNPSELSNTNMAFTVQAKPTITFAGSYTLTGTWRFASFAP